MQVDPRQLVQFATIVDTGSFTAAARALGTTQPALSRLVALLEGRIGAPLLRQRRNPVIATPLGDELALRGRAIRSAVDQIGVLIDGAREGTHGTLRVGAPSYFCEQVLPGVMIRHYGGSALHLETVAAYRDDLVDMVEKNQLDLAFCPNLVGLTERPIRVSILAHMKRVILCRTDHPMLRAPDLSALAAADWVAHAAGSLQYRHMADALLTLGITRIRLALSSDSSSTLIRMVESTDCLCILPVAGVLDRIEAGKLAILPTPLLPVVTMCSLSHEEFDPSPAAARFAGHVRDELLRLEHLGDAAIAKLRAN